MISFFSRLKNFLLIRKKNVVDREVVISEFLKVRGNKKYRSYSMDKLRGIAYHRALILMALQQARIEGASRIAKVVDLMVSEHIRTMQKEDYGVQSDVGDSHTTQVRKSIESVLGVKATKIFLGRASKIANQSKRYWEAAANRSDNKE